MPAKPTWLLHVPEIISSLEQFDAPVVDRATCERLFAVRRRRAISLMQMFGGYQAGRTCLIGREDLIDHLRVLVNTPEFGAEQCRKQKLSSRLDELHRHRTAVKISIPVSAEMTRRRLPELPDGISISLGAMFVAYSTAEQLLSRLYDLARAAADDYEGFCAVVEP
jgi:hypothetical protein